MKRAPAGPRAVGLISEFHSMVLTPKPLRRMTHTLETVVAAAHMGGICQVHECYKGLNGVEGRRTKYKLFSIDGEDVTAKIRLLESHGLLNDVTYQTFDVSA